MSRLTKRNKNGDVYFPKCFEEPCYGTGYTETCNECEYDTAIGEKLAVYEDTGLEPEEIKGLGKWINELRKELKEYKDLEQQGFKEFPSGIWEINEYGKDVTAWQPLPEPWKEKN